jgi:hypothetical protein
MVIRAIFAPSADAGASSLAGSAVSPCVSAAAGAPWLPQPVNAAAIIATQQNILINFFFMFLFLHFLVFLY